ncbi:MAG: hypothetical protein Q8P59_04035, partial [Dehalococcoidia bacterium]|nr:hypothetical protein [Dehalococcoidia bacterium]
MGSFLSRLSLKRRITLSVALGLASILAVFGYVSMWAVQQSTEQIYHEREALARTTARYVDSQMARIQRELVEAVTLVARETSPQGRQQVLSAHQKGAYARLALLDSSGAVVQQVPEDAPSADISSWPCMTASSQTKQPATATLLAGPGGLPTACIALPLPGGS